MKTSRILILFFALALCLGCIACNPADTSTDDTVGENVTPENTSKQEENDQRPWNFHFAFTIVEGKNVIKKGEAVDFFVYITNTSGEDHTFMGYGDGQLSTFVEIEVIGQTEAGEYRYKRENALPDAEPQECVIKHGDTDRGYRRNLLPADAPAGVYSVRLSYGEDYQIFENVLTIVE